MLPAAARSAQHRMKEVPANSRPEGAAGPLVRTAWLTVYSWYFSVPIWTQSIDTARRGRSSPPPPEIIHRDEDVRYATTLVCLPAVTCAASLHAPSPMDPWNSSRPGCWYRDGHRDP